MQPTSAGPKPEPPAKTGAISANRRAKTEEVEVKKTPARPTPNPALAHKLELTPHCDSVLVEFEVEASFKPVPQDKRSMTWGRFPGPDEERAAGGSRPHDIVELRATCRDQPDAAQREAKSTKRVFVDKQSEFPFKAGPPDVAKLRLEVAVLAEQSTVSGANLEIRTTYPDGVPAGLIYDKYRGWCWEYLPDLGVVLSVDVRAPVQRETAARKRLQDLCTQLKTAPVGR